MRSPAQFRRHYQLLERGHQQHALPHTGKPVDGLNYGKDVIILQELSGHHSMPSSALDKSEKVPSKSLVENFLGGRTRMQPSHSRARSNIAGRLKTRRQFVEKGVQ